MSDLTIKALIEELASRCKELEAENKKLSTKCKNLTAANEELVGRLQDSEKRFKALKEASDETAEFLQAELDFVNQEFQKKWGCIRPNSDSNESDDGNFGGPDCEPEDDYSDGEPCCEPCCEPEDDYSDGEPDCEPDGDSDEPDSSPTVKIGVKRGRFVVPRFGKCMCTVPGCPCVTTPTTESCDWKGGAVNGEWFSNALCNKCGKTNNVCGNPIKKVWKAMQGTTSQETPKKRGPGRPPKIPGTPKKRGPGRPRKMPRTE